MKIIFMGTPDFSIPALKKILTSRHEVLAVVTTADKERGRGRKVSYTPVKQFAVENNIPVLQPEKLKDEKFIKELKSFNADLFVVVAFRILPKEVFSIPKYGSFNLHGSLLPKYRGAAPIQRAIINGETKTGLTTFALAEKVDTGNIYLKKEIDILSEDNFETLHNKMSELGAELVLETINLIESENFELKEQVNSLATPAPKITKENSKIDWNKTAEQVHNLVRGLSPYPGAYFYFDDKQFKIFKSKVVQRDDLSPFEFDEKKDQLFIGCGKNSIEVLEIQQEGKKRLNVDEFLRGFSFER